MHPFRISHLAAVVCLAACSLFARSAAGADELSRFEFREPHMGTEFVLRLYAPSREEAEQAATAALTRIGELDSRLSDYRPESELSRLSRSSGSAQAIAVSDDLWNVLTEARRVSQASGGAFDVTVGPYVRLWRRARRTGQMPSEQRLAESRASVGYHHIELEQDGRRVRLMQEGMRLDLGAIAKGYAADEALDVLREHGIEQALVDAGGDLALGAPPPGEPGWRVAIAPLRRETGDREQRTGHSGETASSLAAPPPPGRGRGAGGGGAADQHRETPTSDGLQPTILRLSHCGVATSGDAYQFIELERRRYSHIIDPRTGIGVVGSSSVTVIAPSGTAADALASAVSVLGPEDGLALIEETPGAGALLVTIEDGQEKSYLSSRMNQLLGK